MNLALSLLVTLAVSSFQAAKPPALSANAVAAKTAFNSLATLKDDAAKARVDALKLPGTIEFLSSPEAMMGFYSLSQSIEKSPEGAKETFVVFADLLPKIDHLRSWDGYTSVHLTGLARKTDPALGEKVREAYAKLIERTIEKREFPGYDDPRFNADTVLELHQKSLAHLTGNALRGKLMDQPAPEMNFLWSSDPKLKKLSDLFPGKVVVLDFWATWCKPCIALFPKVREMAASYEGKPVVFVGVTSVQGYSIDPKLGKIDCKGDPKKEFGLMPDLMKQLGVTWTVAFSDKDAFNPDFDIMSIPHMAVIDQQGIVRYDNVEPEELKAKIDSLLAKS
jgi:thiol-disulfide isomerase/thioredoxin